MTAPRDPRLFRDQARAMESRLDQLAHTAQSADHTVTATVTGRGKLVDLRISDNALDRAHPRFLGNSIVQAVRAARGAAHSAAVPELAALLGKEPPRPSPSPSAEPATQRKTQSSAESVTGPRRTRSTREEVSDESFDQIDFLTDDDSDEQGGLR